MFIAVDGIDGSGKTTLVRQLAEIFQSSGDVFVTKEPTDYSKWGQRLRQAASQGRLSADVELEHFKQDRNYHIEQYIKPALNDGKVVITDRYVDSTLAFQSNDPEQADQLYLSMVDDILVPDITFIIDCPVDLGLERINARDKGKFSQFEKKSTLDRAANIYKSRAGDHYFHLDGSGSKQHTLNQALEALRVRLGQNHPFSLVVEKAHDLPTSPSLLSGTASNAAE